MHTVVPAAWEAEAGGFLKPKSWRQPASVRLGLKKKKKQNKKKTVIVPFYR
jgi:hypothetical protein